MPDDHKFRPSFWTFNIGHALTLVTMLGASIAAYYAIKIDLAVTGERMSTLSSRTERVESTIIQLAAGVIDNARQDERLRFIERRLDRVEDSPRPAK